MQPLSVVIPTLNEEHFLTLCVSSLLPQLREYDRIYVADGGSTDNTIALAEEMARRDPRVIVIENPGRTQAAAVNLIAQRLSGRAKLLIRADAHNAYPINFVDCLVRAYNQHQPSSVVVRVETIGATCFQRAAAAAQNSRLGNGGSPHRAGDTPSGWVDHGRHALFDLTFFEKIGGYDQSFRANEDAEFDMRVLRGGGRIWLCSDAPVRYFPRSTVRGLAKQYFYYGAGRFRSGKKHNAPLKNRQLLVLTAVCVNLSCLLFFPFWPPLLALPLIYALACGTWACILAINSRDVCVLASGPAAMVMHTAWCMGYLAELLRCLGQPSR